MWESLRSDRVKSIASSVRKVTIDTVRGIKVAVYHVSIKLFVLNKVFEEGIVIVAERQSFSAAKVEKHVSINVNDMAAY